MYLQIKRRTPRIMVIVSEVRDSASVEDLTEALGDP